MRLSEYASTRKTRGSYKLPRSVQQSIPIDRIYADGIWQSGNVFSMMWQISDINYAILHELLSDEMRPTLLALCGGSIGIIEDGELCWPLPGHTYISCNFGDDDAFGNSGHRGTDIPAPEGTPILAAHGGTVIISGWNNSYGNQVLLDNGAGLSTRYAHMTAAAVSAGETVTAGQVIGYVGNTGDSTGFHLHFEVMQNGVRVNPLDAVTPQ